MNAVESQEKVACRFYSYPVKPEYVLLGKNVDPDPFGSMRRCRICRRGPTVTTLFLVDVWRERFQIPLKVGHHRPASETPFKWRFAGGPMMAQHW